MQASAHDTWRPICHGATMLDPTAPASLDPCPVEPLLLRPDEVARRLSISRAAVYRLIASGTIPSVRLGGSRRVSQTQLSQLIKGLELEAG